MSEHYDLIVRHGTVIDGTRSPRFEGDLAITGDRIARVGRLDAARAEREIDASGKLVTPGFIDAHTHDDRLLLSGPAMTPKVSQGVTTVVVGNCGISLAPIGAGRQPARVPPLDLLDDAGDWYRFESFAEYGQALRDAPPATNAYGLVGHSTLRVGVMDALDRPATPIEIERMRDIVRASLAAGASGVSTGLYYEPAAAAPTEEVIEVCRPLAESNGIYCTHMRNEAEGVVESLEETFRIGRALDVPVVISHHKVVGVRNQGRSPETLAHIARHMATQPVGLDCYPYCASSTILSASRLAVASKVLVTWSRPHPELAGRDLEDIARGMGVTREEAVRRLVPAGAIYFSMDESDVQRILAFEHTMVGSDGLPHDAMPHPRLWGTFPRVLGHYSRSLGLFPLETAVYKMTGLTARTFGMVDRGVIRAGAFADLCIFDEAEIDEAATFDAPVAPARGIVAVLVNGRVVYRDGHTTDERPGRLIRRAA